MSLSWVGEIEKDELGWREAAVWPEKDAGRVASQECVTWSIGSGEVFSNTCGENLVGKGGLARGVQDMERQD